VQIENLIACRGVDNERIVELQVRLEADINVRWCHAVVVLDALSAG